MRRIYVILMVSVSLGGTGIKPAYSQSATSGFYVIINSKVNCANEVNTLTGHGSFCLPNVPVITSDEFESIGEITRDRDRSIKYLELTLSQEGFTILRTLAGRLPDTRLALVVDNKVAGVFEGMSRYVNRILPISGPIDSNEIEWIHNKIGKTKP